jgi:hypothetical protein
MELLGNPWTVICFALGGTALIVALCVLMRGV